ncbi:MAG TPA: hypothetical protein H9830_15480 [Candidatus Agrococcus pullicola]|uniref:Acetolactate synthase-1/2/3 large subunit n=1 Tax=Candidatus Agrococcus pullicola TaxID=2838429 RepID=A0A9D2C9V7_9MICO|nr:hypothetical protein [Candidatus Agrococcus pullicola]
MPETRTTPNGGDRLVTALIESGAERVFGLPGIQLDPIFDALARQNVLELTTARHEQAVAYMADGYARSSGKPGIGVVVPGPGVLNALAGLATAYACNTPVLLICGQIDSTLIGSGRGALHEIPDQTGILRSLTRWHARASYACEIPALVAEALAFLESGAGPAALEVPVDVLHELAEERMETAEPRPMEPNVASRPIREVGPQGSEALSLIRDSERPLLLVGGGCRGRDAVALLTRAAERLGAPVVVTENAKGVIDARHELAFERTAYRRLLDHSDLVLALGTRFVDAEARDLPTGNARTVVVNTDPVVLERQPENTHALRLDAATLLAEIVESDRPAARDGWSGALLADAGDFVEEQRGRIAPQLKYLEAIRRHLPDGGILVGEYTQIGYAASFAFPCRTPRDFIWPGYQGTLGYGFATAIGAAIGNDGPVVSVTGDGGFSWTMEELSTLARERPPLTTIIFNDGHYANVRRLQNLVYEGREIASDLTNPDYMVLADAFGIPATRVASAEELDAALSSAIGTHGPQLIEVSVGEFPSPWHLGF